MGEAEHGHDSRRYLHEEIHVVVRGVVRDQHGRAQQQVKCRTRAEQYVHDEREEQHGYRENIYILEITDTAHGNGQQEHAIQEKEVFRVVEEPFS